jgi:hypothetical protein
MDRFFKDPHRTGVEDMEKIKKLCALCGSKMGIQFACFHGL